jgi:hypothetical protein
MQLFVHWQILEPPPLNPTNPSRDPAINIVGPEISPSYRILTPPTSTRVAAAAVKVWILLTPATNDFKGRKLVAG